MIQLTDRLTHSNSVMLISTNRIKELRLRIDTFGLLTNHRSRLLPIRIFAFIWWEKSPLSSFLARLSRFSRARNPLSLALRTLTTQTIYDHATKVGKYKSDDITAAKYFATPLSFRYANRATNHPLTLLTLYLTPQSLN